MVRSIIFRLSLILLMTLCLWLVGGISLAAPSVSTSAPVQATIQAVPSADGESIVVLAGNLESVSTPLFGTLLVPTSHEGSHTDVDPVHDPVQEQYIFRFDTVTKPFQSPDFTIGITTTVAPSVTVNLGISTSGVSTRMAVRYWPM